MRSPLGGLASVLVRCCSTQEDRKRTPGPADTHKPPRTTGRGQHISLVEQLHLLFLQFSPGLLLRCLFSLFHFAHFFSEYFHCVQSVTSSSSPYFHSKLVRLDAPFFQNLCNSSDSTFGHLFRLEDNLAPKQFGTRATWQDFYGQHVQLAFVCGHFGQESGRQVLKTLLQKYLKGGKLLE